MIFRRTRRVSTVRWISPIIPSEIKRKRKGRRYVSYLFELCEARYKTQLHNSSALIRLHRWFTRLKGRQYPHKPGRIITSETGEILAKRYLWLMSTRVILCEQNRSGSIKQNHKMCHKFYCQPGMSNVKRR